MEKEKLAVFDLDGTLFDTEQAHFLAYQEALTEAGYEISRTFFHEHCFGKAYQRFLPLLAPGAEEEQLQQLHRRKQDCYHRYLTEVRPNRQLFDLLRLLRPEYATALVTTGSRANSGELLDFFQMWDNFDLVLTSEDIPRTKPDPCGFRLAMEHFGIAPEQTVIFEDSPTGLAAAKASGAQYFQVFGPF